MTETSPSSGNPTSMSSTVDPILVYDWSSRRFNAAIRGEPISESSSQYPPRTTSDEQHTSQAILGNEVAIKRERAASPILSLAPKNKKRKLTANKPRPKQPSSKSPFQDPRVRSATQTVRHTRAHDANPHPSCLTCSQVHRTAISPQILASSDDNIASDIPDLLSPDAFPSSDFDPSCDAGLITPVSDRGRSPIIVDSSPRPPERPSRIEPLLSRHLQTANSSAYSQLLDTSGDLTHESSNTFLRHPSPFSSTLPPRQKRKHIAFAEGLLPRSGFAARESGSFMPVSSASQPVSRSSVAATRFPNAALLNPTLTATTVSATPDTADLLSQTSPLPVLTNSADSNEIQSAHTSTDSTIPDTDAVPPRKRRKCAQDAYRSAHPIRSDSPPSNHLLEASTSTPSTSFLNPDDSSLHDALSNHVAPFPTHPPPAMPRPCTPSPQDLPPSTPPDAPSSRPSTPDRPPRPMRPAGDNLKVDDKENGKKIGKMKSKNEASAPKKSTQMEEKATANGTGKRKGRTKQQASVSKVQEAGTATIARKPKPKANAKTKVMKQAVKEEEEEAAVIAVKQEEEESSEEDDAPPAASLRRGAQHVKNQPSKKPKRVRNQKPKSKNPPNVKSEEPPVQLKTEPVVKPNAVKSTKSKANKEIAKAADKGKGKTRGKEKSSRVEPQAPPNLSVPRKIVVIETEATANLAKSLPHPSDITNKVTPPLLSKAKEPSNGSEDAPSAVSNPSRNSSREDTSHTNVKSQPDVLSRILFSNHPPRPFVYSPIELDMFDGLTWKDDIQGRMELSALGWIAGAAYRALETQFDVADGNNVLDFDPPQVLDHDLRMHLYADMELPSWFTELLQLPAQIDERPSEQPSIVLPNLEV